MQGSPLFSFLLHGLIEVAWLALISFLPLVLVSSAGLNGQGLEHNTSAIAMHSAFWGIARFMAAWGCWSPRKWAFVLGIILSTVTIVAAIMIIPAGVSDMLFAIPALIFLLYTWFGDEQIALQTA